ncbi:MAG: UDP-2,3-diacylglucosamine diphosphatase [Bdellovibrionaceae bacterium]|nr:UDP-2,3-diacylglucosamine diphosphatase [Pseudobdellovibrionaceae bacterium]
MESWFLSDIHLKSVNERSGRTLLRFLSDLLDSKKSGVLFLLGDIFDLWVSDHAVFIRRFYPLIEKLKELRAERWEIHYFEGNHDLHLKPYFEDQLGFHVHTGPEYFHLGSLVVRCEHGDQINAEDKAYLRYRALVRSKPLEILAHHVPGKVWDVLGTTLSAESRKRSSVYRRDRHDELVNIIRSHARKAWHSKNFDLIVSGHMHIRDDYAFMEGEKKIRSVNLGSWLDEPTALHLTSEGLSWVSL